jgi:hypothetical protein
VLFSVLARGNFHLAAIHTHKRTIRLFARHGSRLNLFRTVTLALKAVKGARGAESRSTAIPRDMGSALYVCWVWLYELLPPRPRRPPAAIKAQLAKGASAGVAKSQPVGGVLVSRP